MSKNKIVISTMFGSIIWESEKDTVKEAAEEKNARDADLRGADLRGADLRGADLYGANLRDANLRDADLRDADLRDADLRGADLRGANLRGANLALLPVDFINQCSRDILFILSCLKKEIPFLKKMLIEGKVNGTQYEGDCACFIGTLANANGGLDKTCQSIPFYEKGLQNFGEMWFYQIREGDTPETNTFSAHVMKLIEMVETEKMYTIIYKKSE